MGNLFSKKREGISYAQLRDNDDNKFLLYDNVQTKITKNENDIENMKKQILSLHENFSKNILSCNKNINELNNIITEYKNKNLELTKKLKLENIINEKNSTKIKELEMKIMNLESLEEFVSTIQENNAEQERKNYSENINLNISLDNEEEIDSLDEINNDISNFGKSLEID